MASLRIWGVTLLLVGLWAAWPAWAEAPARGTVVAIPVLKAPIEKGTVLSADMLTTAEVPVREVFASTFTQAADVLGQQAVRPLAAGEPLNRLHLRVAPVVARGSAVTVSFSRGGVQLSGVGQALEDGRMGQSIRVLNTSSRATVVGVVSGPATVSVN